MKCPKCHKAIELVTKKRDGLWTSSWECDDCGKVDPTSSTINLDSSWIHDNGTVPTIGWLDEEASGDNYKRMVSDPKHFHKHTIPKDKFTAKDDEHDYDYPPADIKQKLKQLEDQYNDLVAKEDYKKGNT